MERKIVPVGPFAANCVVLWQPGKGECWIVDPGADAEDIVAVCEAHGLRPALIAFTHAHFDHIGGVTALLAKWPGTPVHLAPEDEAIAFSRLNSWGGEYPPTERPDSLVLDLVEGARITSAGIEAEVLSTPGHTPGGVCFHFRSERLLLSGDTLFAGSCGRTDFPGGSADALSKSLSRLARLPADTLVVPGHGASTTIAREVAGNPFINR